MSHPRNQENRPFLPPFFFTAQNTAHSTCFACFVVWSLLSLLPFPIASAQEVKQPWTDKLFEVKDKNGNDVVIKSHDFGTVAHGTTVVYPFVVYNPFNETVHIAGVSSSCSCVTPFLEKQSLQTYEKAVILVQFNADKFSFDKSATITVEIDQPYPATAYLHIKGYIRPDITFTPASINFGLVPEGKETFRNLEVVYSGSNAHWRITGVESPCDFLSGSPVETDARPGQITTKVRIVVSDKAPKGRFSERVHIQTNEDGRKGSVPLLVEGTVPGGITVSPPVVFLGYLLPGQEAVKDVAIRSDRAFEIVAIECDAPNITLTVPGPGKKRIQQIPIAIRVPAEAKSEKILVKAKVVTDIPELVATVPIMAEIKEPVVIPPPGPEQKTPETELPP